MNPKNKIAINFKQTIKGYMVLNPVVEQSFPKAI